MWKGSLANIDLNFVGYGEHSKKRVGSIGLASANFMLIAHVVGSTGPFASWF